MSKINAHTQQYKHAQQYCMMINNSVHRLNNIYMQNNNVHAQKY